MKGPNLNQLTLGTTRGTVSKEGDYNIYDELKNIQDYIDTPYSYKESLDTESTFNNNVVANQIISSNVPFVSGAKVGKGTMRRRNY